MRRATWLLAIAALGVSACSKHVSEPLPPAPPPDLVEEVHPAPFAVRVLPADSVWVRFREALDPATLSDSAVYLKLDTRRVARRLRWEGDDRRLVIEPLAPLALGLTYTVELTPRLRTVSGTSLPTTYRWQFRMLSVRVPGHPEPADGTVDESPFATLVWDSTEVSAGLLRYDIFAGRDSAAVAARTGAPVASVWRGFLIPGRRWAPGEDVYWSVTARNLTRSESADGPVWRFRPYPASAPVDSLVVPLRYSYWIRNLQPVCDPESLVIDVVGSPRTAAAAQWDFGALAPETRVVGAALVLTARPGYETRLPGRCVICTSKFRWDYCQPVGADRQSVYLDGFLSEAVRSGPATVRFESDTLTAHLQAMVRHQAFGLYGYAFSSGVRINFHVPGPDHSWPSRLVLYVARPGATHRR